MKTFLFALVAVALLASFGSAAFKNVVCAKTLSEDFAALSVGDCVRTSAGFTVQLVSVQKGPDAATFRTFSPDGDAIKDANLGPNGQQSQLDREAYVRYDAVVTEGGREKVQAEIRSFEYLPGGSDLSGFPQPAKSIKSARVGDSFQLSSGLKVSLESASSGIATFTLKSDAATWSVQLVSGRVYADANVRIHLFSITTATGGQTNVAMGIMSQTGKPSEALTATIIGDGSHAVRSGAIIQAWNGYMLRIDRVDAPNTGGASVSFTAFNPAGDEISRGTLSLTQSKNVAGALQVAFIGAPKEMDRAALLQISSLVGDNTRPDAAKPSAVIVEPTAAPTKKTSTVTPTSSAQKPAAEPLAPTLVTPQDEKQSPVVAFVDALFAFIRRLFGSE